MPARAVSATVRRAAANQGGAQRRTGAGRMTPSSGRKPVAPWVQRLNLSSTSAGIEYDQDLRRASPPVDALIELLDELGFQPRQALTMFSECADVERAVHAAHRPVSLHGGVFCQADRRPSPC